MVLVNVVKKKLPKVDTSLTVCMFNNEWEKVLKNTIRIDEMMPPGLAGLDILKRGPKRAARRPRSPFTSASTGAASARRRKAPSSVGFRREFTTKSPRGLPVTRVNSRTVKDNC